LTVISRIGETTDVLTHRRTSLRFAYPLVLVAFVAGLTMLGALPSWAGKFNKVLSIGDLAPSWSDLPGVDDRPHSLADWKDAQAVVLVFICNHCPMTVAHEGRLVQLQKDYAEKGVQLVAVSVSRMETDRLDKMKERAVEKGFNFPYVYDESQKIGRDYGALATPQVFVLDANRKVAYMGAMDDGLDPAAVKKPYLREAIDAVLSGQTPSTSETRPVGCEIEYQ
jgi:peroxiredoxin